MAFTIADRVREQVSGFGGGTGVVTLPVVAVNGFQTFLSGWGASGTGWYCLSLGSQWETGLGTLNAGGTTLTRTTVYNGSSGAGVSVNFAAGTLDCFGDIPAKILGTLVANVKVQKFTAGGTYTPSAGMVYAIIECVGGGGAGGGATSTATNLAGGGGGGSGGYSRKYTTAAAVGASQTVTIGAGGTAGTAGNNPGNAGGDTSVGALCIGKGGSGGSGVAGNGSPGGTGGSGGVAGTGDLTPQGNTGFNGNAAAGSVQIYPMGGAGACSIFGTGGGGSTTATSVAGNAATIYGGGGGGASSTNGGGASAGGVGAAGIAIITEFCNQ